MQEAGRGDFEKDGGTSCWAPDAEEAHTHQIDIKEATKADCVMLLHIACAWSHLHMSAGIPVLHLL